jgi:2-polyprenyl-3-methyl-5-hydroxy-6-metoxy-1,4-benzoquinol methylase
MPSDIFRQGADVMARSPLLRRGKALFAENSLNWNMPLSKFDKLLAGSWLILDDYSKGFFPPTFSDQQKAYQAEKDYRFSLPGFTAAEVDLSGMMKPFWFGKQGRNDLKNFNRLTAYLEMIGLKPPAHLLELGCGSGWMAEFLATMGFQVCATTISEDDVASACRRIKSLETKGISPALKFLAVPMESVHTAVTPDSFDAAFVYAALHHAFNWRETLRSSFLCLKNGGWLLICSEPNVLHTCISYRVAKLSNTHEIGFSKRELTVELKKVGFRKIISVGPKLHCWFRPHWLLAQK